MASQTVVTWLAGIGLAALLAPSAALAADSAYTTQDYQKCPIVKDEQGAITRLCKGYAGIPLNWYGSDDDTTVDFGRDGEIGSSEGLSFANAGDTIEWRGRPGKGGIKPDAAIVRYSICQNIGGDNCRSALYVYKLAGAKNSCLLSVVDGRKPNANITARALADKHAARFRCGEDEPIKR